MTNKKAQRWGVKVCVIAESQTRYTHQVEIYKGISNTARYPNGLGFGFFLQSDNLPQIWIWQLPNNLLSYGKRFQVIPNPLGKKCTGGSYAKSYVISIHQWVKGIWTYISVFKLSAFLYKYENTGPFNMFSFKQRYSDKGSIASQVKSYLIHFAYTCQ